MKKIILQNNVGILNFKKYNIFDDGDLEIKIEGNTILNSKIEIIADNGLNQKRITCKDNKFTIRKDFVKLGVLKFKINIYVNNLLVKSVNCEDLIVVDTKEGIEAIPEMVQLKNEFGGLKEEVATYKKEVETLTKLVKKLYGINLKVGE